MTVLVLCSLLLACEDTAPEEQVVDDAEVLAVVGSEQLLIGEVTPFLNDSLSSQDSAIFIQNYTERWVRDRLMIQAAEENVPDNVDIEQLVNDYRASLLVHHFEQKVIEEQLDTAVSRDEILKFYEKNKDQFQNDKDLVRAHFIKLKKPFPDQRRMEGWWKEPTGDNLVALRNYCQNYGTYFNLDAEKWLEYNEIARQLPRGSIRFSDLRPDYERNFADFNHQYLIRVFETVRSTENPPVALVADQAKMIILHERKLRLLEQVRQELYNEAIQERSVKIMTK